MPLISFFNFGDYFHAQRKKIIREAILKAANNLDKVLTWRYSNGEGFRCPRVNEIVDLADLLLLKLTSQQSVTELIGRSFCSDGRGAKLCLSLKNTELEGGDPLPTLSSITKSLWCSAS